MPLATMGEEENLSPSDSFQNSCPVFALRATMMPVSFTKNSVSPTTKGDGRVGAIFSFLNATWLLVMLPCPSGLMAKSVLRFPAVT